ncbi:MAG: 30S ribosomal protein S2 [bacterium]|nr:30S ribosomal protein S2 [bacterium]
MQKGKKESLIDQMFNAGAHYGYSKTRRHPSVSSYICATKNKTDIIDLEKTAVLLGEAEEFIKSLGSQNKMVLFVGAKPEAKEIIKKTADSLNMPYVVERWIGGTISNFSEIKKRIAELENYNKENKDGGLEKYTKKERVVMAKKMERLSKYYSGLFNLKKAPDAMFIIDPKKEHIAQTEAMKSHIPVIALLNSDTNIKNIDFPIVANDTGMPSINLFADAVANAYKTGQNSIPVGEA